MTTMSAADLMNQAFAHVASRDLDALVTCWHDDIVEEFVAAETLRGIPAVRAYFAEMFAAVPDWGFEPEQVHDASTSVAIGQWRLRGTFSGGPFRGISPTGRAVDLRGIDVMTFEDGKLIHNTVYYDGATFARQVGLLPQEGSLADRGLLTVFNTVTAVTSRLPGRR